MKKTLTLVLAVALMLTLAACGGNKTTVTVEAPAPAAATTAPKAEEKKEEVKPSEPEKTEEPEKQEEPVEEADSFNEEDFNKALSLKDSSVEELFEAIGEPVSVEEYTSSCMGDGEDGAFHYPGFTVYTYRDNSGEIVYDVIKD